MEETATLVGSDAEIRLVAVHNLAKLWIEIAHTSNKKIILLVRLYPSRSILSVWLFMKTFIKRYGRPKLVCTDGGPWYYNALKALRLKHQVISGGFRNYVECWFLTLKHRIGRFDKYFPCRCGQGAHTHIQNWLNLYGYHYNNIHIHRTLKTTLALLEKGLS